MLYPLFCETFELPLHPAAPRIESLAAKALTASQRQLDAMVLDFARHLIVHHCLTVDRRRLAKLVPASATDSERAAWQSTLRLARTHPVALPDLQLPVQTDGQTLTRWATPLFFTLMDQDCPGSGRRLALRFCPAEAGVARSTPRLAWPHRLAQHLLSLRTQPLQ